MPSVKVPTNFNIEVEFEIPEFYKRLIALVIDYILLYIYIKIAEQIIKNAAMNTGDYENLYWLSIAVIAGPVLVYFPITEITMRGQTIGKKIMNLQVVNENGGKASISQLLIRWLVRDIWFLFILQMGRYYEYMNSQLESVFLMLVVIGYFITEIILVVSSKKCQRIGDILARTILIDIKKRGNIEDTVFQEVADNYVPSFPEIMRLSDKDINAIKSILETARKKGDYYMAESAATKIKAHLKIETSMDAFDFLDVLLKDYNYLSVK
jgi:uncharacterized RDD family membrane protein YckC